MIQFGIPKRVIESKEKYPSTPVLTMEKVEGIGFNRRFVLNKKAVEELGVSPGVSSVVFAFDEEQNKAFIANQTVEDSILVGKNLAFSNKRYYDYIVKLMKLDTSNDVDLELKFHTTLGELPIYELVSVINLDVASIVFTPRMDFVKSSPTPTDVLDTQGSDFDIDKSDNVPNINNMTEEELADYLNTIEDDDYDHVSAMKEVREVGSEKFIMNAY